MNTSAAAASVVPMGELAKANSRCAWDSGLLLQLLTFYFKELYADGRLFAEHATAIKPLTPIHSLEDAAEIKNGCGGTSM